MTQYLISFPSSAMEITDDELPEVSRAARAVIQEAKDAGVFVFTGGLKDEVAPVLVAGDGTVTDDAYPELFSGSRNSASAPVNSAAGVGPRFCSEKCVPRNAKISGAWRTVSSDHDAFCCRSRSATSKSTNGSPPRVTGTGRHRHRESELQDFPPTSEFRSQRAFDVRQILFDGGSDDREVDVGVAVSNPIAGRPHN
jgi:hypothetical protein